LICVSTAREHKEDRGDIGLMMSRLEKKTVVECTLLAQDRHVWRELLSSYVVADSILFL